MRFIQLALKFHPDKNRAPGADDIFKKVQILIIKVFNEREFKKYHQIAQAYDCLSNKEKRVVYDTYGDEDPEQHYRDYYKHFSEDISPEVLNLILI